MNLATKAIIVVTILSIAHCHVYAQDDSDDDPKMNSNLGMPISAPLNPAGRFVNLGLGITYGAGYNFTRRHAVIGEFMWNNLFTNNGALTPIRVALQNPDIRGSGNLFAFTGNYRFELRGRALGTYLIGGGGWYFRTAHLSQTITTGSGITCTPVWIWWGFSCESGTVTADQTIASSTTHAIGMNAGIGFTARVGDAPYRMYVESRYHYVPSKGINTQLVVVTVGIRY
jgi:Outer membrane protein beta-barrel domain